MLHTIGMVAAWGAVACFIAAGIDMATTEMRDTRRSRKLVEALRRRDAERGVR